MCGPHDKLLGGNLTRLVMPSNCKYTQLCRPCPISRLFTGDCRLTAFCIFCLSVALQLSPMWSFCIVIHSLTYSMYAKNFYGDFNMMLFQPSCFKVKWTASSNIESFEYNTRKWFLVPHATFY